MRQVVEGDPLASRVAAAARPHIVARFSQEAVAVAVARLARDITAHLVGLGALKRGSDGRLVTAGSAWLAEQRMSHRVDSLSFTWSLPAFYSVRGAAQAQPSLRSRVRAVCPQQCLAGDGLIPRRAAGGPAAASRRVIWLSSVPPRPCGIARFTLPFLQALRESAEAGERVDVVAVAGSYDDHVPLLTQQQRPSGSADDDDLQADADGEAAWARLRRYARVVAVVDTAALDSYAAAARVVVGDSARLDGVEVVVQHEFGLWQFAHVLCLVRQLRQRGASITWVLHTVSEDMDEAWHAILARAAMHDRCGSRPRQTARPRAPHATAAESSR